MRSHLRRTTALAAGLALASAGLVVPATPAFAGQDATIRLTRGGMWWTSYGDTVTVKDRLADGYWIRGYYRLKSGGGGSHTIDVSGAGKENSKKWDIREGLEVQIQMCYMDELVTVWCSDWADGVS